MKYTTLLLLCSCLNYTVVSAQCDDYEVSGHEIFHANQIRTIVNTGGDMFWDLDDAMFQVPYKGAETPNAIFAAAIWIGGYDELDSLKLAAQTFRQRNSQEYLPGPLTSLGTPFSTDCALWDKVWSVRSHEVLMHIQDYDADGVVDNQQESIFGWPGLGNIYFEDLNGFAMPDYQQGYAPFYDMNGNGIYEPQDGEYPLPDGLPETSIPDQITWHVLNDVREHRVSHGDQLGVEIQQTTYAFQCDESSVLNSTIFVDFKIINRATSNINATTFGLWMDPDLGCFTDDFVGSSSEHNAFFVYNEDSTDGTHEQNCNAGVQSYHQGPPALSGLFLNNTMTSYMYIADYNVLVLPEWFYPPREPIEFYRFMNGTWRDGVPLTVGGTGYDTLSIDTTTFAFEGDPNDPQSWALSNLDLGGFYEWRTVASTQLGTLNPGDVSKVSMAFTLHLDPSKDNLGNVEYLYENLPLIQNTFDEGFVGCPKPMTPCVEDCVWAGDANHDGIANHEDILHVALAYGRSGPVRNAPLAWAPYPAKDWAGDDIAGVNVKHADLNADGVIDIAEEIDVLEENYGLTHDDYQPNMEVTQGNEIIINGGFELFHPPFLQTTTVISLNPELVDALYGVAFTVIYDTQYFPRAFVDYWSPFEESASLKWKAETPGVIEYAAVRTDGQDEIIDQLDRMLRVFFTIDYDAMTPDQDDTTEVYLVNIKGVLGDGSEVPLGSRTVRYIFLDEEPSAVRPVDASEVKVYPIPSSGVLHFEVPENMTGTRYEVITTTGMTLLSGRINGIVNSLTLPSGVYTLMIYDSVPVVKRLVVMN